MLRRHARPPLLLGLAALLLSSCQDDPELVRKIQEQKAEIAQLELEIGELQAQLTDSPGDQSGDLEELRGAIEAETRRITGLKESILSLEARRNALREEYEAYKKKYPLR